MMTDPLQFWLGLRINLFLLDLIYFLQTGFTGSVNSRWFRLITVLDRPNGGD